MPRVVHAKPLVWNTTWTSGEYTITCEFPGEFRVRFKSQALGTFKHRTTAKRVAAAHAHNGRVLTGAIAELRVLWEKEENDEDY